MQHTNPADIGDCKRAGWKDVSAHMQIKCGDKTAPCFTTTFIGKMPKSFASLIITTRQQALLAN